MILYIGIIMLLMLAGWLLTLIEDDSSKFPYGIIGGIVGVIIPIICLIYITETTPTALDVYQGKTALEITYRGGIPVDSVVVFKDKK